MQDRHFATLLLAGALGLGVSARAQDEPAETSTQTLSPEPAAVDPATPDTAREVTLGQPPVADPLSPATTGRPAIDPQETDRPDDARADVPSTRIEVDPRVLGVVPGDPLPPLRREGEFLRDRAGHLLPAGERGYAVFVLDPDPSADDDRPLAMVVAPNRALESLETLVEQRGEAVGLTVSGQVHTYRGVNYLIITAPPTPWLKPPADPDTDTVEDTPPQTDSGENTEPTVTIDDLQPADDLPPDVDDDTPLSPEEELAQLLAQRSAPGSDAENAPGATRQAPSSRGGGEGVSMPDIPRGGVAADPAVLGIAPGQAQAELLSEGAFVVRRTGRLIRSGDGTEAMFVFDADGRAAPQPPMILQACQLLEEMEAIIYTQGAHLPFVISGQVQTYRGANYLLPTIMRQEFDHGNLE